MIKTAGQVFFQNDIMIEIACEKNGKCNNDQRSFKAYLARWMGYTMIVAPHTKDAIMPKMQASAKAAAAQCNYQGNKCGLLWTEGPSANVGRWLGVGEQMAALEVMQNLLIGNVAGPVTEKKGGISKSDPSAGSEAKPEDIKFRTIGAGDKAGAGILTTLVLVGIVAGAWWMVSN